MRIMAFLQRDIMVDLHWDQLALLQGDVVALDAGFMLEHLELQPFGYFLQVPKICARPRMVS